jgi:hypothetical protein
VFAVLKVRSASKECKAFLVPLARQERRARRAILARKVCKVLLVRQGR